VLPRASAFPGGHAKRVKLKSLTYESRIEQLLQMFERKQAK
jgi:hypothetical protein